MGNRTMTEETKRKIAATREEKKALAEATGQEPQKRASVEDQVAAVQAMADSGDAGAAALMPAIDVYVAQMTEAKKTAKAAAKKVRKILNTLK